MKNNKIDLLRNYKVEKSLSAIKGGGVVIVNDHCMGLAGPIDNCRLGLAGPIDNCRLGLVGPINDVCFAGISSLVVDPCKVVSVLNFMA